MSRLSLKTASSTPVVFDGGAPLAVSDAFGLSSGYHSTSPDSVAYYSPPPSPTRMTSVARFDSPELYYSPRDTPSLLDETLPSSLSSPSFAHTPMAFARSRDGHQDSMSFIGLGFTGLLQHDGSFFDGTGALPKRIESAELGFFVDDSASHHCPEHQEDAWRKRITLSSTPNPFAVLSLPPPPPQAPFAALWSPTAAPLGCSSPAERAHSKKAWPMPSEPDTDDVFFTRSPELESSAGSVSDAASFGFMRN